MRSRSGRARFALLVLGLLTSAGCASGKIDPATDVTDRAATLRAHGKAGGQPTQYWFQYGKTTSYGNTTPRKSGGSGNTEQAVSERVTGLDPDTTYNYRACASNQSGSGCTANATFRTGSLGMLPGFQDTVAIDGLNLPIALRFAPDGRVFVAEKSGLIKVFDSLSDPTATVFADLRTKVHDYWDRGLTGMALDPGFPAKPFVYVAYSHDAVIGGTAPRWGDDCPASPGGNIDGCVISGRLSRLEAQGDHQVGSEQVLIEDWCQQFPSHSTGDIEFGTDGSLYVSGGDGASFDWVDYGQAGIPRNPCGDPGAPISGNQTPPTAEGGALRSQDLRTGGDPVTLDGTIARVNPDTGQGLPDNPGAASSDPNERRIIASGLRNPFRFTIRTQPWGDELWIGDVGWNAVEEINRLVMPVTAPVENFGWPCYEGGGRQDGYDAADLNVCEGLYASGSALPPHNPYPRWNKMFDEDTCQLGSSATSGVAFLPAGSQWPAEFNGALFFADYARNCIWVEERPPGSDVPYKVFKNFRAGADGPVDLQFGPGGDLYYPSITQGRIRRIHYTQGNQAPRAVASASPTNGNLPLTVNFSGSGSSDPEGSPLSYAWDLDADGAYDDSTAAQPNFTYNTAGSYPVGLKVTDPSGASATDTVAVTAGNTPPTATIATPSPGFTWKVGQAIAFSGGATDAQDGTLAASRLSWTVTLQHCPSTCHAHPLQGFPGISQGSFPAPDHDYPSYIDLKLTATDSGGLTDSHTVRLDPRTVQLSLRTNPTGLQLAVGSLTRTTPFEVTVIEGSANTLSAPTPQTLSGTTYDFGSWSDGGLRTHGITALAPGTYTANFTPR